MLVAGGVVAAGLAGLLVGCAQDTGRAETSDRNIEVAHIKVDGAMRTCVIYHGIYAGESVGGLSCKFGEQE